MKFVIPHTIKEEHEELHQTLQQIVTLPGETGQVAKKLAQLLHPHFTEEEQYALPPLGLLPVVGSGNIFPQMNHVVALTDQLKNNLPQMLTEHKKIGEVLEELKKCAAEENHPNVTAFANNLLRHAKTEEEILYPASILVGEYLKLRAMADETKPALHTSQK